MKYSIKADRITALRYWAWEYGLKVAIERAILSRGQQWLHIDRARTKAEAQRKATRISMAEAYTAGRLRRPMQAFVVITNHNQ